MVSHHLPSLVIIDIVVVKICLLLQKVKVPHAFT